MDSKELFAKTLEQAKGCVGVVRQEQLTNATPCSEWDLKALLNHMVNELLWMPPLLDGKTIADVGDTLDGDLLGDDAVTAFSTAAEAAVNAVTAAGPDATVHLSYGDFPASHYIGDMATDMLIHGWDVGQSVNCSQVFEPTVAQAVYDHLAPSIQGYRDGGFMGAGVEVSADATIQTKLLALAGRNET